MLKIVFFFMAALLIASSVTLASSVTVLPASVSQSQSFCIGDASNNGMASIVALTHGDTGGSVDQSLDVVNIQSSPCNATPCFDFCFFGSSCDVEALQTQDADLDQEASACGECGIVNVNTYLDAAGAQDQFIGFSTSTKQQAQSLGVAAQQVLTRADGAGGGDSVNDADLSQIQAGSNAGGSVFQSTLIDAYQTSGTGGAANSTAALASTLLATTTQAQQVY
jgi:hypothetical protein